MAKEVKITLPDNSVKSFKNGVSVGEIALSISEGLLRNSVAGKVDGVLVDLSFQINEDSSVEILTSRSEESHEILLHSTAHLMAQAIKELYPNAKIAIGPSIDNGFYYDIDIDKTFNDESLVVIEAKMKELSKLKLPIDRQEFSRDEALEYFKNIGEDYKVELISELDEDETISAYRQGDFIDLCKGPHLPSTGKIKFFKLLSTSGAYWRGDENNKMLQRIYGTAFFDKKDLKAYLQMLEEAMKRDHRKLGKELDLFSFHQEGPGFPFWHPNGMVLYNQIQEYWSDVHRKNGYKEIKTPIILNEALWHRSGHWDNYKDNMYTTTIDEHQYSVKPMNCPGHLLIYKNTMYSYRDLPLKLAEMGLVHRHEKSGVLSGLFRVRQFTQDDAHIFCTPEKVEQQIVDIINLVFEIYGVFGFEDIHIELSTKPEKKFIGSQEIWDKAESALEEALKKCDIDFQVNPGDGAFYGPKIDFHIKDSLKRSWQLGTIQLDFSMPERFELEYVGEDGSKHQPVMIHRAILGSFERFIGIIIEHFGGDFPLWLAPIQAIVLPISEKYTDYAESVKLKLLQNGIRTTIDNRSEKVGAKIRQAELNKIPVMLIVGEKEESDNAVSVRRRFKGDLGSMDLETYSQKLLIEIENKTRRSSDS
ncbi:MAG: threonine--tRNA ligase [Candidatus Marinimicrobia bacterium]|nr:threonine--tRNA ligase [Candidatus Neomarinimicrobiota bacterium]MBL7022765.1 threonine--tRNA ligase [Candidatus Neomarinimicrobiota bacterium]MBL7109714.1 threonine--tRNA ligase [Candidatus Neomarinimicrobiota bacterium]